MMNDYEYLTHIDNCGLKPRFNMNNPSGDVLWGISERSIECYILHDINGNAYDGIYLPKNAKFAVYNITPAYKNKLLMGIPADHFDIKDDSIILPVGNGFNWGIVEIDKDNGEYLLIDNYDRAFKLPKFEKGEFPLRSLILPAYDGKILRARRKYKFHAESIEV